MHERITLVPRTVAVGLLTGLLYWLPTSMPHAQIFIGSTSVLGTSYQGQAAAVSGIAAGSAVSVANTGSLSVIGGAQEASAMGSSVAGGISAGICHTAIIGEENVTSSEAAVANVSFTGNSSISFFLAPTTITADFIMSQATAACAATALTV